MMRMMVKTMPAIPKGMRIKNRRSLMQKRRICPNVPKKERAEFCTRGELTNCCALSAARMISSLRVVGFTG